MLYLGLGFFLVFVWLRLRALMRRADPRERMRLGRSWGGLAALGLAVLLLMRGQLSLGLVMGAAGAGLIWGWAGISRLLFAPAQWRSGGRPGLRSGWPAWQVRGKLALAELWHALRASGPAVRGVRTQTGVLDVAIDPATGTMTGRVIAGLFRGRTITSMQPAELALLWQDCRFTDAASAQLVEAHLDRRHPTWRTDLARGEREMTGADGRVSPAEALKILGLLEGAGEEEIRRAHRALILKMHPDRGGSTYLSAKINEAKDVLLARLGR